MNTLPKSKWKFFFFLLTLLVALLLFPPAVAQAQTDCSDPASGCTATPVDNAPGCYDAFGAICSPTPPAPPAPTDTNTPEPTATPTRRPTVTPTQTTTATPTASSTPLPAAVIPSATETLKSSPTAQATAPAPLDPQPSVAPPRPGFWQNLFSRVNNWLGQLFRGSQVDARSPRDFFWLTKVIAVQGSANTCVGGTECSGKPANAIVNEEVRLYIMPGGEKPLITIFGEENIFPALCQGQTGADGCTAPVYGKRPYVAKNVNILGFNLPTPPSDEFAASLPDSYVFVIPQEWLSTPGTHLLTAYINYRQQSAPEFVFQNNYLTFSIKVGDPSMQQLNPPQKNSLPTPTIDPSGQPTPAKNSLPTATLVPSDNPFSLTDPVIVLQNENCVQGCSLTAGWGIAGQPLQLYVQATTFPYQNAGSQPADPLTSGFMMCKGVSGASGCSDPLPIDSPPYVIPAWFAQSPSAALLMNKPQIARFTVPAEWIPSTGLYAVTLYVNYGQSIAPETQFSDNMKTIYLNVSALHQ